MAPNETIFAENIPSTYKLADKAMGIPIVNDVVSGVKKIAEPVAPYVGETLTILQDKVKDSLSEDVRERVGSTLGSLGSSLDNLACNGLDQLTTAVPSLQTTTTPEMVENTKEAAIVCMDTAQEYLASFKMARFGIRVMDTYLSLIESPVSMVSSSASTQVLGVRRHLRAVRRAGARREGEPCSDGSLWMEMAEVFKVNVLLGFFGVQLVKLDKEPLASSPRKGDINAVLEDHDDNVEEDPDYVPEDAAAADDSLEYRSDTEVVDQPKVGLIISEVADEELEEKLEEIEKVEDCFTPKCVKDEHEGRRFDDREIEVSSSEED